MSFAEAAKLLLVSFDSNPEVQSFRGLPLDLAFYEKDSFKLGMQRRIDRDDPYYRNISRVGSAALKSAFASLPSFSEF